MATVVVAAESEGCYRRMAKGLIASAVLAYNKDNMMLLVQAVRSGNQGLSAKYSDQELTVFLKPQQIRSHVRCITHGVEVSVIFILV